MAFISISIGSNVGNTHTSHNVMNKDFALVSVELLSVSPLWSFSGFCSQLLKFRSKLRWSWLTCITTVPQIGCLGDSCKWPSAGPSQGYLQLCSGSEDLSMNWTWWQGSKTLHFTENYVFGIIILSHEESYFHTL